MKNKKKIIRRNQNIIYISRNLAWRNYYFIENDSRNKLAFNFLLNTSDMCVNRLSTNLVTYSTDCRLLSNSKQTLMNLYSHRPRGRYNDLFILDNRLTPLSKIHAKVRKYKANYYKNPLSNFKGFYYPKTYKPISFKSTPKKNIFWLKKSIQLFYKNSWSYLFNYKPSLIKKLLPYNSNYTFPLHFYNNPYIKYTIKTKD